MTPLLDAAASHTARKSTSNLNTSGEVKRMHTASLAKLEEVAKKKKRDSAQGEGSILGKD